MREDSTFPKRHTVEFTVLKTVPVISISLRPSLFLHPPNPPKNTRRRKMDLQFRTNWHFLTYSSQIITTFRAKEIVITMNQQSHTRRAPRSAFPGPASD